MGVYDLHKHGSENTESFQPHCWLNQRSLSHLPMQYTCSPGIRPPKMPLIIKYVHLYLFSIVLFRVIEAIYSADAKHNL